MYREVNAMPLSPVVDRVSSDNLGSGRIDLMGLPVDCITEAGAIAVVIDGLEKGEGGWVMTPNLDQLRQFRSRPELRGFFSQADLIVADGTPLVWASRLQRTPLPERIAGSDLVWSLTAEAALYDRSIYLLGEMPEARRLAESTIRRHYPGARIVGSCSPPLGFEHDPGEVERIRRGVVESQPDIVYVALGFPKQERLIAALRPDLPSAWFVGVGISLSFIGGTVKRAPQWVIDAGLEWIHRLAQEPHRLAGRYVLRGLPFASRLFLSALGRRAFGRAQAVPPRDHLPGRPRTVFVRGGLERQRTEELAELFGTGDAPARQPHVNSRRARFRS